MAPGVVRGARGYGARHAAPGRERDSHMTTISELIQRVSEQRIRERLFHLARDPLPCRKANCTLPGHAKSTLAEADDFIEAQLRACGYDVRRQACQVQAYAYDATKPIHHRYAMPAPDAPFYTVHNLTAELPGAQAAGEIILLCAHKDSQSWIDSPGANDNAIGTAVTVEIADALSVYRPKRAIHFLFCNEEHRPWTSVAAAEGYRARGERIVAVLNTDGPGVKSDEDRAAGRMTNLSLYSTPEGQALAGVMAEVNERYALGLQQEARPRPYPNDDDGSFVKAGFPAAIANFGSFPKADPQYHMEGDTPDRTDVKNAALVARAIVAAVVTLDRR
jgi:hypothetical protein